MAALSRGQVARPVIKKSKGGTPSSRKHHFESFSHRIAKLKIDPVRRGRRTVQDEDISATFSYFTNSLDEWRDLNTSQSFTSFCKEVAPLCESLPQIIHYNDRILDLLVRYMEKGDRWSEEPLLSLTAHFAHDLGSHFEAHFERVVTTVSQLAAKHQDVEVIEWSFTCLAWLFKYLSRLLVPDLRPVFTLMAPLLGKEHQKPFVTRFAAEALSFLLRKAGAAYHKDKQPLSLILQHVLEDFEGSRQQGAAHQYQQGLMFLLTDSMKGVQRNVHSSGNAIIEELLIQTYASNVSLNRQSHTAHVVSGVLTAMIHYTDTETFAPLLEVILAQIILNTSEKNQRLCGISARVLFIVAGVRKGTRIRNWKGVIETLNLIVSSISKDVETEDSVLWDTLASSAVIFQTCPLDVSIPYVPLFETFTKGVWERQFLSFCNFFAELGSERFQSLVFTHLKKFITSKLDKYGEDFCVILPKLIGSGVIPQESVMLPQAWQDQMVEKFLGLIEPETQTDGSDHLAYACNAALDIFRVASMSPKTKQALLRHLRKDLDVLLATSKRSHEQHRDIMIIGNGFLYLAEDGDSCAQLPNLWPQLCNASTILGHYVPFWEALLSVAKTNRRSIDLQGSHMESLRQALMCGLGSPSHELRLITIELLEVILQVTDSQQDILALIRTVEQIPLDILNVRSMSMHIRRVGSGYKAISSHGWLAQVIPTYCFGLLHVKFAQVWDDACAALTEISETKEGATIVARTAFHWLKSPVDQIENLPTLSDEHNKQYKRASEFECTNLLQITEKSVHSIGCLQDTALRMKDIFLSRHVHFQFISHFSRTQALRVLNAVPQIAEKESRLLVPILLRWTSDFDHDLLQKPTAEVSLSQEQSIDCWARKDQKALLSVFAKFTNPKVLYKTSEVYAALLQLLSNGDVEIQKSALRALMTWKQRNLVKYEENLFNLLDDARFREEIAVFMDASEEENHLREEHRDEVLPIILRLLYGKVISGKRGQEAKRKAVFIALTRFGDEAIRGFLEIALGPLSGVSIIENRDVKENVLQSHLLDLRKQLGFLHMLEDLLATLQSTLASVVMDVIDPLLYCLITASRRISTGASDSNIIVGNGESTEDPSERIREQSGNQTANTLSLSRTIRQRAFHSLNMLFENAPESKWDDYIPAIVDNLVSPRLAQFPIETAQSVSGLLKLFSMWSKSLHTVTFLVEPNSDVLPKVVECLDVPSAKEEVKLFVIDDIVRNLIRLFRTSTDVDTRHENEKLQIRDRVLKPYANVFLSHIGDHLRKSPTKELLEHGVHAVAELASCISGSSEEARNMVDIASFLLRQPSKRVSPQTKTSLLIMLDEFLPHCHGGTGNMDELLQTVFDVVCSLFSFFRDRASRQVLCNVIHKLSNSFTDLQVTASLCDDVNAFSTSRLDEPDFDRRSKAFSIINEDNYRSFSARQWQPLVQNMLFYIKDTEELSIRVNASFSLRRFVDAASSNEDLKEYLSQAVMPGIQHGMQESSELVRVEYLHLLAHLVKTFPEWSLVADLEPLLSGDEESSFFGNVLHIQQHRRLRALRRLASLSPQLRSRNVAHILIPLLEHFIMDKAEDESAHNLAGEATRTLGALVESLDWPQYRSLLRRYITYLTSKEDMQKMIIKLLGSVMDGLSKAVHSKRYSSMDTSDGLGLSSDLAESHDTMEIDVPVSALTETLPSQDKLAKDLTNNILSPLTEFLHKKDESTVSLRVPIAISLAKALQTLPQDQIRSRLPPVLLDVCHILKSKSQDARDMARNTLADISMLLGPDYVGFVLKALRTALQRGYQLHVLSFTMHHIFVKMAPVLKAGNLDYCVSDIVAVIMDDIFGIAGQEKDAEDYISKMKEVKSSKSYDSMDIISRIVSLSHLSELVWPTKALTLERLNAKTIRKIDELLRRIGLGILQNSAIKDRDILVFCYELIQEVYKMNANAGLSAQDDPRTKRYLINMKGAEKSGNRGSTTSCIYKIARFSLDILRNVLKKHVELQTPQNLAGFIPIIGDALVQGQEEVQIAAIRLLTTIVKVPLPQLDKDAPVYIFEAVRTVQNAPSTNAEYPQASLKLVSAILRDRPDVEIKENDVAKLLKRLLPDLDEPDRQGVTFGFLKAVMARKIVATEVYEVMDRVAAMMVTNQTRSARDLARSNYFQFLMEYPQAKARFTKQMEFLIKNLRYDYVEGRQSVMEALHLILSKFDDSILQEVLGLLFVPLISSMSNDDSSDCRAMAGALLKKVFERADDEKTRSFISDLKAWLEQDEDPALKRVAIQCWGLYFEVTGGALKEISFALEQFELIISEGLQRRDEEDWELIYYSLMVISKISKLSSETLLAPEMEGFWTAIRTSISYPHAWVKLMAAKLVGTYLADLASTNGEAGLHNVPLAGSQGLQLAAEDMLPLANNSLKNLLIPNVSEDLCAQSVRNLAFLARCFAANEVKWNWSKVEGDDDVADEDATAVPQSLPEDGDEWGGFSPPPEASPRKTLAVQPTAIHRLVVRLSAIIRRETKIIKLNSLYPKTAVLSLLETLASKIPIQTLNSSLHHLLTTLHTLTDPTTTIPRSTDPAFNDAYKALIEKAREVMDLLQKRMGTSDYVAILQDVQRGIRERREGRRAKRAIEAISAPEKFGKEKRRRQDVKREKRKEKGREARGLRRGW